VEGLRKTNDKLNMLFVKAHKDCESVVGSGNVFVYVDVYKHYL